MSLVPTIYTTLRVFWLGNMPGDWSYSIAGQLSWVNLIYEVVSEAIILPLFYFTGQTLMDKKEFANRIKTGLAVVLSVYLVISLAVIMFTKPLLNLMATDASIIDASATYIRIEAIANIFSIILLRQTWSKWNRIFQHHCKCVIICNYIMVTRTKWSFCYGQSQNEFWMDERICEGRRYFRS